MNDSDRELLQRAQAIVVRAKLRLIEQNAQWRLRIIPGLALTPLLPPLTSAWVVAVDGYPLGRLYRIKPDPLSQQWIAAAYGPPYVKPGVFSTRLTAMHALLENHGRHHRWPVFTTAIIQERSEIDD